MNKSTSPGSRKRNSSSSKQSSTPPKANKKGYGSPSNETSPKTNAPTAETATAEAPAATTSPLPTLLQIEAERLTRDLPAFVRAAWPILEPVTPLLWNWHLDLICDYLTLIKEARFKDVCGAHCEGIIFNVPPRTMKSLLITVMFPAWLWTSDPARRWMFASYAEKYQRSIPFTVATSCVALGTRRDGDTWSAFPGTRTRKPNMKTPRADQCWPRPWVHSLLGLAVTFWFLTILC
jgi:hypothetical protein